MGLRKKFGKDFMVSIEEAQRIVLMHAVLLPPEVIPLLQGLGKVSSEDVYAPWDLPSSDHAAMDGYAFSHDGLEGNSLRVAGFLPAGGKRTVAVAAGEAIRIMTGAPIPPGCDTVVPFEDTEETEGRIRIKGGVKPGFHIRKRGEDTRLGDKVIAAGALLRPQEIGMLASFGNNTAKVYSRPRVGVLATGDELSEPGARHSAGMIIDSNSYGIAAQILEVGGEPILLGIARDDKEATREKISEGLTSDLLVTTGGVSVGDKDFVKEAILDLGGEIKFWKVNMKPGKPFAFAVINGKPVFALPGNPAAAMVTFEMFVRPMLLRMMGYSRILRPIASAILTEAVKNNGERPHLIRVFVEARKGGYYVSTTGNQSSARISSLTSANGLVRVAPGDTMAPGDSVDVLLFDRGFEMREILQHN